MRRDFRRLITLACLALLGFGSTGCVERSMKISSTPSGARVFVNDREVGLTPVEFSFLWYGDYDIILRREGYHTLKTHYLVNAPWYQYPPIDLIAECLIPGTIKDQHILPDYTLEQAAIPPTEEVVERALEARSQALSEGS